MYFSLPRVAEGCGRRARANRTRLMQVYFFQTIHLLKSIWRENPGASHHADSLLLIFRSSCTVRCSVKTDGGAKRDRTADLLRARQALSQLSYSPVTPDLRSQANLGGSGWTRTTDLTLIRGAL